MKPILIKTFKDIDIAKLFLYEGSILFREIKYYADIEDFARVDNSEGKVVGLTNIEKSNSITELNTHGGAKITTIFNGFEGNDHFKVIVEGEVKGTINCFTLLDLEEKYNHIISEIEKFGKYCIVIKDVKSFFKVLDDTITKHNNINNEIEGIEGMPVRYVDGESGAFVKDRIYSNESEFRLAIGLRGKFPKQFLIKIGDISQHAEIVEMNELSDFLGEFQEC